MTEDAGISGRINVSGDVHLVLCDDKKLTASKGIRVAGTDSLTVYAGDTGANAGVAGTGALEANAAGYSAAGIGGNSQEAGGDITVNGGEVTATGGQNGAGIGGGERGAGGNITVNGGKVTATGGDDGAGIGGGKDGSGGKITLNYTEASRAGMSVTASNYHGTVKLKEAFQTLRAQSEGPGAVAGATAGTNARVPEAVLTALAGRTLVPLSGTPYGIVAALDPEVQGAAVAITVDGVPVTEAVEDTTVTLTVPKTGSPEACQYGLSALKADGTGKDVPFTATDTEGIYTFEMPDTGVTAAFTMWAKLQEQINTAANAQDGGTVKLEWDVTAIPDVDEESLVVNGTVTLDLNGHTIDRGLKRKAAVANGNVITVNPGASLTVTDTSANWPGKITGGNNTDNGGGVYVKGGSFTMGGGVIGGTDSADANSAYNGGGVYVKGGIAAMSGGAIRFNIAQEHGSGVYVNGGAFKVSGAPTVTDNDANGSADNVFLPENMTITVADTLTEGASIGVYVGLNGIGGDITTDYAKHNNGDEPSKYFTNDAADYTDYVVGWNNSFNEAMMGKAITRGATAYEGDYDGKAHTALTVDVTEPASDATVTYSADGKTFGSAAPNVTDAGDHTMYYRVWASGYAGVRGTAVAKIAPIDAAVTITGKTGKAAYDGREHKVSGYDFEASTPLYTEQDFTFSGNAEAARTDAGTAMMGLKEEQFANKSPNFREVTFTVTDGWQTVEPIDATVTITGKTNTAFYDGKAHKVSGYDFKASTSLYTEGDITFSGAAEATQTGVGTATMGLKANQYANKSTNFKSVVFNVTDGWQKVERAALTVTTDAESKTYGDKDPALTYKVEGLVAGESLSGNLVRDAGEDVGSYEIRQGTLKATDNYALSFTGAKLTIGKKAVTVTADAKS